MVTQGLEPLAHLGQIKHFWRYELMKLHIMRVAKAVHRYLMAIYS